MHTIQRTDLFRQAQLVYLTVSYTKYFHLLLTCRCKHPVRCSCPDDRLDSMLLLLFDMTYLNYQFLRLDILSIRSFVVIGTECSDCVLVEQIINTSDPPPYDPLLFLRVTDTSSSCHSKNLFSVSVFIPYLYDQWHIAPTSSHPCTKCLTNVTIIDFDARIIGMVFKVDISQRLPPPPDYRPDSHS